MTNEQNTTFPWQKYAPSFVKWETAHQLVSGRILEIREGEYKGKTYPELVIDTPDGTRVVSAGQANLQRKLVTEAPSVGDDICIEYLGLEDDSKPGQNPMKLFRVELGGAERNDNRTEDEPPHEDDLFASEEF